MGVPNAMAYKWEIENAATSMTTLKAAVRALGVWGWKDLTLWLADGSDDPRPPAWLEDPTLDPFAPEPPHPGPAMPSAALAAVRAEPAQAIAGAARDVFRLLDGARERGELRSPLELRAWVELHAATENDGTPKRQGEPAKGVALTPEAKEIFFDRLHVKKIKGSQAS